MVHVVICDIWVVNLIKLFIIEETPLDLCVKPALDRLATSAATKTSPVRAHLIWSPASQCEQEAAANSPPPRVPAPAVVVSAHRPVSPLAEPDSTQHAAYQAGGRCWYVPPTPPPLKPITRVPSRRSEHGERSFQVKLLIKYAY